MANIITCSHRAAHAATAKKAPITLPSDVRPNRLGHTLTGKENTWTKAEEPSFFPAPKNGKAPATTVFFRTKNFDGTQTDYWLILAAYDIDRVRRGRLTQVRPLSWDEDGCPVLGEVLSQPLQK